MSLSEVLLSCTLSIAKQNKKNYQETRRRKWTFIAYCIYKSTIKYIIWAKREIPLLDSSIPTCCPAAPWWKKCLPWPLTPYGKIRFRSPDAFDQKLQSLTSMPCHIMSDAGSLFISSKQMLIPAALSFKSFFLLALEDWSRSYRGHKIMWATTKEWSLWSSVPAGTVLSGATVLTAHFSIRDNPLWNPDDFELLCYENTRDSLIYRSLNENMTAGLFYK